MKMKRRIKTKFLLALLIILYLLLGLIARIDNDIITLIYLTSEALLINALRKRYGVRVRWKKI